MSPAANQSRLTDFLSFPRLMYSRRGTFSLLIQLIVGIAARASKLVGANVISQKIRDKRTGALERHKKNCIEFFEQAVSSGNFDLLLDFGAHTGEQSIGASSFLAVRAYEPDPRALRTLEANAQSRTETSYPLEILPFAVSDRSEMTTLNFSETKPESTGGSTLVKNKRGFQSGKNVEVRSIDVLSILNEAHHPERTIIKMDIEGMEYRVLSRMMDHPQFRKLGLIFVEFHERKLKRGWRQGMRLTLNLWFNRLTSKRIIEWY